jgi:protein-S-isoprenylcysteine O-methyltransferase Ste14
MPDRPDNPGVWIPPPLLYAAAIVGGFLLNRQWRLPIGTGPLLVMIGGVLVIAWAVLAASSIRRFRRSRTSMITFRPATALVVSGPYRFTRNPMYVSLALLTVAFALFLNTWWIALLLVPVLLLVQWFVIKPEERYLYRRFGAEYERYVRRVRRWL